MEGTGAGQTFKDLMISGDSGNDYSSGYIPTRMLDCPSDITRKSTVDFWPYYGSTCNWTSYGYNEPVGGRMGSFTTHTFNYRRIASFRYPSLNSMMTELEPANKFYPIWYACNGTDSASFVIGVPHHGNGVNHLFIDGAAGFRSKSQYVNEMRFEGDIYYNGNWGNVAFNYRPY